MYRVIFDDAGQVVLDHNLAANPQAFLKAIALFRDRQFGVDVYPKTV